MTKSILLAFLLLSAVSFKPADDTELKWYAWNEAYPLAKKTGKILLVDTYTDWCGWCKKMDRDTYTNHEVIKKLNKDFIVVKFNPELSDLKYQIDSQTFNAADFYMQLCRGEKTGYPTTYFIHPAKKQLFLDPGYRDPATFIKVLDHVLDEIGKK